MFSVASVNVFDSFKQSLIISIVDFLCALKFSKFNTIVLVFFFYMKLWKFEASDWFSP